MVLKLTEDEIDAFIEKIDFEKGNGLVPAVVQDASNNSLLMQAYMNKEALKLTLTTGKMHYFSRTKNRLWMKGEQSKHYSLVENAFLDCDNDAILFKVQQVFTAQVKIPMFKTARYLAVQHRKRLGSSVFFDRSGMTGNSW